MNQESSPNAEEKKSTLRSTVLGMVAMFVILLLVLSAIVVYYPEEEEGDKLCPGIAGGDVGSTWGIKNVINSTVVDVCFGKVNPNPRPTSLTIKLMKDDEDIGTYAFQTDEDGPLLLIDGEDVGTLTFVDLADNQKVNVGDVIRITNLTPDSVYVIAMYWVPTGDCIAETYFTTPPE
jgi:hypothetical protein